MKKCDILELEQDAVKLGLQGFTAQETSVKLHCSRQAVSRYYKKNNIIVDGRGGKNAKITFNPFLPRTSEGDYWIGMLIADGWIDSRKGAIWLKQGGHNIDHMLKYHAFLKNLPSLYYSKDNRQLSVGFGHKPTSEWLKSIGIVPNKSLTISLNIPFTWDIVRGYFDGDGGFSLVGNYLQIKFTSGSIALLEQLQKFLISEGIQSSIRCEKETIYRLNIIGKNRLSFCNKMYNNSCVCMDRKFQIWDSYIHAQVKFRELLETPEEDNQQPSLDGNIFEGSTTSSESNSDNNSTTSAEHSLTE